MGQKALPRSVYPRVADLRSMSEQRSGEMRLMRRCYGAIGGDGAIVRLIIYRIYSTSLTVVSLAARMCVVALHPVAAKPQQ